MWVTVNERNNETIKCTVLNGLHYQYSRNTGTLWVTLPLKHDCIKFCVTIYCFFLGACWSQSVHYLSPVLRLLSVLLVFIVKGKWGMEWVGRGWGWIAGKVWCGLTGSCWRQEGKGDLEARGKNSDGILGGKKATQLSCYAKPRKGLNTHKQCSWVNSLASSDRRAGQRHCMMMSLMDGRCV